MAGWIASPFSTDIKWNGMFITNSRLKEMDESRPIRIWQNWVKNQKKVQNTPIEQLNVRGWPKLVDRKMWNHKHWMRVLFQDIAPDDELLVWYGPARDSFLGIPGAWADTGDMRESSAMSWKTCQYNRGMHQVGERNQNKPNGGNCASYRPYNSTNMTKQ